MSDRDCRAHIEALDTGGMGERGNTNMAQAVERHARPKTENIEES